MKECLVNLFLNFDGFGKGGNDATVGADVVEGKFAAFAVLEPLVAHLVAADVVLPDLGRHALEVLGVVDIDALTLQVVAEALFAGLDLAISLPLEAGDGRIKLQVHQAPSQLGHSLEQLVIGSERNPGKVDAQKLGVLLPVGRCIEHGVHVVKDALGRRFLAEGLRQFLDQLGIQVGLSLRRLLCS